MKQYIVKPMESDSEIRGKAYVHWEAGEIYAIYVLKEYYDKRIGYALMCAALEKLSAYKRIAVWVLEGNHRAIKFYERCGFQFDGTKKQIKLGTANTEIRISI